MAAQFQAFSSDSNLPYRSNPRKCHWWLSCLPTRTAVDSAASCHRQLLHLIITYPEDSTRVFELMRLPRILPGQAHDLSWSLCFSCNLHIWSHRRIRRHFCDHISRYFRYLFWHWRIAHGLFFLGPLVGVLLDERLAGPGSD